MKVWEVSARTSKQNKCGHCDRVLREGEWVLEWVKVDPATLYDKIRVLTHVECIRRLIADVPWADTKTQFESLRTAMASTGLVFPE